MPNANGEMPGNDCRQDHVTQSRLGLYAENHVHWNARFRTVSRHSAIEYAVDGYTFNSNTLSSGPYRMFHPVAPRNVRVQVVARV